jgi:hypothetical protein
VISKHQRSTLWEIHSITNIEVETDRGWAELATYAKTATAQGLMAASGSKLVNVRTPAQTAAATQGVDQLP